MIALSPYHRYKDNERIRKPLFPISSPVWKLGSPNTLIKLIVLSAENLITQTHSFYSFQDQMTNVLVPMPLPHWICSWMNSLCAPRMDGVILVNLSYSSIVLIQWMSLRFKCIISSIYWRQMTYCRQLRTNLVHYQWKQLPFNHGVLLTLGRHGNTMPPTIPVSGNSQRELKDEWPTICHVHWSQSINTVITV